MQVAEIVIKGIDLLEKIRKSEAKDDEVIKAVEEMKQTGVKMLRDEEWQEENGLILRDRKVYIPRDKRLRAEVIQLYHNTLVGGHGEQWKTTEFVTRNFWWPGVIKEVKKYIEAYNICQRNKNCIEIPAEKSMPNTVPEKF